MTLFSEKNAYFQYYMQTWFDAQLDQKILGQYLVLIPSDWSDRNSSRNPCRQIQILEEFLKNSDWIRSGSGIKQGILNSPFGAVHKRRPVLG